jgi:tetratricopeptide (TPR) repeat protein
MAKRPAPPRNDPIAAELNTLGQAIKRKQYSAALPRLMALRQKAPRDPRVLWMLGVCNGELGRHAEAIEAYAAAVKADPKAAPLRLSYIQALQRGGEYEEALLEAERLIYRDPANFHALRMRISILMDLARWDRAAELLAELRASPVYQREPLSSRATLLISAARLAPDHREPADAIADLAPLADDPSLIPAMRIPITWHLGRLHEAAREYDAAFSYYKKSKEIDRLPWDPDEHARRVDKLIECWRPDCGIPFADRDGSRLIFILGMMRSGTSLTEQMLAQIDAIHPGGEMNAVSRQVAHSDPVFKGVLRPLPYTRANYTKQRIDAMATEAWTYYDAVSRDGFVTDKQPYNYYYVPLIARLFPGCTIIHCSRDPQDTCLSNFFQSFSRPHPQTHDLEWLGRYYRDYQRLMDAWRALPDLNIIEMPYEDLVADPRGLLSPVLDRIGLPWDDAILNFHESDRAVRTSSRDQVRRPLYKSSVKKHERYAAHLAPLRRGLGLEE